MALTPQQEREVAAMLSDSGVSEKLAAKAEGARAAEEAALRAELAKNEARLAALMPKRQASLDAAKDREEAARKEAQAALEDHSKASAARSQLHDEFWAVRNAIEPQLRRVADPRIHALATKLRETARTNGRTDLSHEERSRRVRATLELAETAERLMVSPTLTADSLQAEIERLRKAVQELWSAP